MSTLPKLAVSTMCIRILTQPAGSAAVHSAKDLREWLLETGMVSKPVQLPPDSYAGFLSVIIDARGADCTEIAATLAKLFQGTLQRVRIQILVSSSEKGQEVKAFTKHDSAISVIYSIDEIILPDSYILVCPAGVLVGTYSVEAAIEAIDATGCHVLRAVVDGATSSVELWQVEALKSAQNLGLAEENARVAGKERWVSGSGLGLHVVGQPSPKQFLKKGLAQKHELTVLVRDTSQQRVRLDYEYRIRRLQAELDRAKKEIWSSGCHSSFGMSKSIRLLRKGPRYILARIKVKLLRSAEGAARQ